MTTNIHYLIAGMAVLLVVIWQYSRQRQMDDRNSRMFRRLLSVVSLDVAAELVSTGFILYAPYSFNVCRMLSNTVFYLFQALLPLLLLAYKTMGRTFVAKLALCTVSNSLFLSIIPIPAEPIIPDMLTSCLVGGILAGFSNGLVLTCGASCGGLDILGLYLSKKGRGFTVGKFSLLFNAALYTLCLILFSAPTAIYSAIYTVFNALFVDRVHQQNITTQVLIVTKLRDLEPFWELGRKMDRGITYWTGHGAYTGDEVQILCICLSKYEIETLQQEVQKIDSHAFFMMQEGVHTRGNFKRHLNP